MTKNNEEEKKQKILKWRLSDRPTVSNLSDLVKSEIITKEEAKQILLDETEYNSKDFEDVLEEIKLLRKLVLELSEKNPETTVQIIERSYPVYIEKWRQYPWIQPYISWCGQTAGISLNANTSNALNAIKSSNYNLPSYNY